ncbi:MAG: glycosyltransferase family 39 protein, partial [Candidatus Altiarchaeota archaeon]|nr:glycosyltransferase family 39 protein [Candidatus Altiarchaeota archaeon]
TTLLVYFAGSKLVDKKAGLLAALLYAIYPHAIFWGRMNYNNNLLAFMIMLSLVLYLLGGRWKTLSYATMGLSVLAEFNGVSLVLTAFLLTALVDKKNLLKNMGIVLAPAIAFTLIMLYLKPEYFLHDLGYQLNRFGFTPPLFGVAAAALAVFYLGKDKLPKLYEKAMTFLRKEVRILFNEYDNVVWKYGLLITLAAAHFYCSKWLFHEFSDSYFIGSFEYYWFALAGLLLVRDTVKRNTALIFALPILIITLKIARFDHMCIPMYPLFALGCGILLPELFGFLKKLTALFTSNRTLATILPVILLAYPFVYTAFMDADSFILGNNINREDVNGMMKAAEYVSERSGPNDITLTTTHLARFVRNGNATLFIQGIAIHRPIEYYAKFPTERFVYNVSYRNAKYIVIPGSEGLAWLANVDNGSFRDISSEIEGWGVEAEIGPYFIYRNPNK